MKCKPSSGEARRKLFISCPDFYAQTKEEQKSLAEHRRLMVTLNQLEEDLDVVKFKISQIHSAASTASEQNLELHQLNTERISLEYQFYAIDRCLVQLEYSPPLQALFDRESKSFYTPQISTSKKQTTNKKSLHATPEAASVISEPLNYPVKNRFAAQRKFKGYLMVVICSIVIYCIAFFIISACNAPNGDRTVYITYTGECYHSSGCSSLEHSKIQCTLQEAIDNGYRDCQRCEPPELIPEDYNIHIPFGFMLIFTLPVAYLGEMFSSFLVSLVDAFFDFDCFEPDYFKFHDSEFGCIFIMHIFLSLLFLISFNIFK